MFYLVIYFANQSLHFLRHACVAVCRVKLWASAFGGEMKSISAKYSGSQLLQKVEQTASIYLLKYKFESFFNNSHIPKWLILSTCFLFLFLFGSSLDAKCIAYCFFSPQTLPRSIHQEFIINKQTKKQKQKKCLFGCVTSLWYCTQDWYWFIILQSWKRLLIDW